MGFIEQLKQEAEDIAPALRNGKKINKIRRGTAVRVLGTVTGALIGAITDITAGSFPVGVILGAGAGDIVAIKAASKIKLLNVWVKTEPPLRARGPWDK